MPVFLLILAMGLFSSHLAVAQEVLKRIPERVEPEAHKIPRTKAKAIQIHFPLDADLMPANLSVVLSEACAHQEFNQKKHGRYFVAVPRRNGAVTRFGYAQSDGMNLRDPKALRGPDQVYLFHRDGTSQCEVYVFATIF